MAYAESKQLKIGIKDDSGTLTPYSAGGSEIMKLIYDTLFDLDPERVPQPWLVDEYSVSDDRMTYTFKLCEGIKWHDGKPLTSEDVKFSYEYVKDQSSIRYANAAKAVKEINIKDDLNLEMVLVSPQAEILTSLFADLPIIPKHLWEGVENPKGADIRVGSGPYKLKEYENNQFYKLEANHEYFKGKPLLDELILPMIGDTTAIITAIKAGQIDVSSTKLPAELAEQFRNDSKLKVVDGVGFSSSLLLFNEIRPPFDQKEFRQALTYAINVEDIVKTIALGEAAPGNPGFVSPKYNMYNDKVAKHLYSPEKSKEILDSINFKDSDGDGIREDAGGKPLDFEILTSSGNSKSIRTAELIAEWFKAIGVKATIKSMESSVVDSLVSPDWDAANDGDFDMAMWGWGDLFMTSPNRYVEMFHSNPDIGPSNITKCNNPELDKLLEEILIEGDDAKRQDLIDEMQVMLSDECTLVSLMYENASYVYNPKAFDQWVDVKGKGIINKFSLVDYSQNNDSEPASATDNTTGDTASKDNKEAEKESESSNIALYIGIIAVVTIIGFIVVRRKKK